MKRGAASIVGIVGLALLASGCGDGETTDAASTPPAAPTTAAAATPTPTPTPAPTSPLNVGCPVDADTLFAALKANRKLWAGLSNEITGVRDVTCYRGYATARTIVPPALADPAFVLYEYDRDSATWKATSAGTDAICTDLVPRRLIPYLPGCINS